MDQAIDATQIDKRPEIGEAADGSANEIALFDFGVALLFLCALLFFGNDAAIGFAAGLALLLWKVWR